MGRTTTQSAYDLAAAVAQRRQQELNDGFPTLDRAQYASESEYRSALLQQYAKMRQLEYQHTCLAEGMKAYDVSLTICQRMGSNKYMNRATWDGCKDVMQRYPDMKEAISDSCYVRIPTQVTNTMSGAQASCCAVSSKALESQISSRMGYDGNQNFVPCYNNNSAYHHRAANGFVTDPACRGYVERGNLWRLIESGKAGAGATVAIHSSGTDSGYHAKTIVAVNYDEQGHLKSYVLQGNNRNSFEVISDPNQSRYNDVYVGDMNRWMSDKFNQETRDMQSLTTEQLQAAVSREKQKVSTRISELETCEKHLFDAQKDSPQVAEYANWYVRNANVSGATRYVMQDDHRRAMTQTASLTNRQQTVQNASTNATQNPQRAPANTPRTPQNAPATSAPNTGNCGVPSAEDTRRMASMIDNMNKHNGTTRQLDKQAVIDSLSQQFGDKAYKVLLKALMEPSKMAKELGLQTNGNTTSREIVRGLCELNDSSKQQRIIDFVSRSRQQSR